MKGMLTDKDKRLSYALYKTYPKVTQNDLADFFSKIKDTSINQGEMSCILKEQSEKGEITDLDSVLIEGISFFKTLPDYR